MSTELTAQPAPAGANSIAMVRTLAGVAILSGLLIVFVYQATLPGIQHNLRMALEAAIFEVVPGAESRQTFLVQEGAPIPSEGEAPSGARAFYAAYDASGQLAGVAIEAAGQGYADIVRVLYGYDPDTETIIGMMVLESRETPGLGDKIGKDPVFLSNFDGLAAMLNEEGTELAHDITAVKGGVESEPWQIDGISGATISSVAVAKMIDESANNLVPYIHEHLQVLKAGGK